MSLAGFAVALGICVATVLTHQHYLIDTIAGMALGAGAHLYFLRPRLAPRLPASLVRLRLTETENNRFTLRRPALT